MKNEKWLITVDLDGTALSSSISDNAGKIYDIHPKNIEVFSKLEKLGHKVIIVTGRNWTQTKPVYEKLKNKNLVITAGGARISNPTDSNFPQIYHTINKEILMEIFNDELVKEHTYGFDIEVGDKIFIDEIKTNNWHQYLKKELPNWLKWEFNGKTDFYPQIAHIALDVGNKEGWEIVNKLKRKYGHAALFRCWKNEIQNLLFIEINPAGASKGSAVPYLTSYYNIPMANTISFGDGVNDKEMLETAAHGVAMKNAKGTLKFIANDVTDLDNSEGGVGVYLEKFFDL